MTMRKPWPVWRGKLLKWVCHDGKDQDRFEAWTNAQLDELEQPSADDILHDSVAIFDQHAMAAADKSASDRLRRGRLLLAVRAKDHAAVQRLANTEQLTRLALRAALAQRGPGRATGEWRPWDYSPELKCALEDAARDVELVRGVWLRAFGRRNRTMPPTAIEIASRRNGIEHPADLENFRKNQHRISAS